MDSVSWSRRSQRFEGKGKDAMLIVKLSEGANRAQEGWGNGGGNHYSSKFPNPKATYIYIIAACFSF
ncbi:unnamed protein product [Cylicocyclus nassatus]|uniref:Uncharacterized protein n=1 Tax=Cylicocyclus nassatus TaxID=53992 RepID=A0AA36DMB5_CYLNA|nr:unnamed protein product [Cylicocyclus nassatus]